MDLQRTHLTVPMGHRTALTDGAGGAATYSCSFRGDQFSIEAEVSGPSRRLPVGSEAEFITEHDWGYNRQRNGDTLEYRVAHPPWRVWDAASAPQATRFRCKVRPSS